MTTTPTIVAAAPGTAASGGELPPRCKRSGCAARAPAGERGRTRLFCSEECRRRHYNAARASPAGAPVADDGGPAAALTQLTGLLAQAAALAGQAAEHVAATSPERSAASIAEAEAARRRAEAQAATARAQAAEAAESAQAAWETAEAADQATAQPDTRTQTAAHAAQAAKDQARALQTELAGALGQLRQAEHAITDLTRQRDQAPPAPGQATQRADASIPPAAEQATRIREQAGRDNDSPTTPHQTPP